MSADERMAQMKERAEKAEGERNQALGDLKAEVVANRIARSELRAAEAARDEDQEACRVVMAERDDWKALHAQAVANNQQTIDGLLERVKAAESDAQAAHAGAAAMREALESSLDALALCGLPESGQSTDAVVSAQAQGSSALSSPSGAAMLERVRGAEEQRDWGAATTKALLPYQDRCARLLSACQSLSRRWRKAAGKTP